MHQTFYIDIDEEITSVVERLKKARTGEIIIVVPKRALLIQSIVNLRILKKEADERGLQLMMVTQDKLGKILIEKAGIFVQQKMENLADGEIDIRSEENEAEEGRYSVAKAAESFGKKDDRLSQMGSESFFNELSKNEENSKASSVKLKRAEASFERGNDESKKESLINMELVNEAGKDIKKSKSFQSGMSMDLVAAGKSPVEDEKSSSFESKSGSSLPADKLENFFYHSGNFEEKRKMPEKKEFKEYSLPHSHRKRFWIFGGVSLVAILAVLAVLFVPKTEVRIFVKAEKKEIDSEISGELSAQKIDIERETIPMEMIEVEEEISQSFEASGKKSVSNQKARGSVVIYNEYDSNPQPLVATTRLLTEDGKLFRLVSGVTVPGMTKDGDKTKPGSVEAQVVADKAGQEYNIGPATFKIPGFENSGNDKYNKFYAKSTEVMKGGGDGSSQSNFVTEEDINLAKNQILSELDKAVKEKIKAKAGEGAELLDEAMKKEEAIYKLSNSQNDVADSFQVAVQMKVKAFIFKKEDIQELAAEMISRAGNSGKKTDKDSISLLYGKPNVDFDKGLMDIKFHAVGEIIPDIDLDLIKREILGKNEAAFASYLNGFPDISKAEVAYWPPFLTGRISFRKERVEISLDKD